MPRPHRVGISVVALASALVITACQPVATPISLSTSSSQPSTEAVVAQPSAPDLPPAAPSSAPAPAAPSVEPEPAPSAEPSVVTGTTSSPAPTVSPTHDAAAHLRMIREASSRNTAADAWQYRDAVQEDIPFEAYLGPRVQEYRNNENPNSGAGNFRLGCSFSHFAYDDPLLKPGQPGGSHLHMFFGNTDVNAFTTADTLRNSGSSTCNGFVRNGYWAPAMFDGRGQLRIPENINVYYKGYGEAIGKVQTYPEGMAMVSDDSINKRAGYNHSFECQTRWGATRTQQQDTIPVCQGGRSSDGSPHRFQTTLKFDNCWNGEDPSDWKANFRPAKDSWYTGDCPASHPIAMPNAEFVIHYHLLPGDSTEGWYLSSDVNPETFQVRADRGASNHGDLWPAWDAEVNRLWVENCSNVRGADCSTGYLENHLMGDNGLTLRYRDRSTTGTTVPAAQVHAELCGGTIDRPQEAAYCNTKADHSAMGH